MLFKLADRMRNMRTTGASKNFMSNFTPPENMVAKKSTNFTFDKEGEKNYMYLSSIPVYKFQATRIWDTTFISILSKYNVLSPTWIEEMLSGKVKNWKQTYTIYFT